ncbi:MAG: acyl-CoA carboxylase subunit epsilon [Actinomycetota bacterium]|nr:acyl-CoA carboxylase subunit epsilon [Actinomycetota bacterium]MDH4352579.1 acyl-CoA carboxylase subunit epsilon [Actinomycetota bacterium]MDH5277463.1 acyl-CoA carboxylase subunit epsilon [Actinomycetota bacterium]
MTSVPQRPDAALEVLRGAPTPSELAAVSRAVAESSLGSPAAESALDRWRSGRRAALRSSPPRSAGG